MKTLLEPDPAQTHDSSEESHIVCCDDHDTSLCGTLVEWTTPVENGDPSCVVCIDLDYANYCPYTGICRHSTKPGL